MPKWEDIRDDLFEAVISVQPALSKEQQEQIVVFMQSRGHNMVWNAIRYVPGYHCRAIVKALCKSSRSASLLKSPSFPHLQQRNTYYSKPLQPRQQLLRDFKASNSPSSFIL